MFCSGNANTVVIKISSSSNDQLGIAISPVLNAYAAAVTPENMAIETKLINFCTAKYL